MEGRTPDCARHRARGPVLVAQSEAAFVARAAPEYLLQPSIPNWTSPSPRDGGDALAKAGLDGPAGLDRLQRLRQAMSAYRRQGLLRAGRTAGGAAARRRVTWQTS